MNTLQVHLPEDLSRFVDSRVGDGSYGSADELVHAALKLLQHKEQEDLHKLEALRAAIAEGDASGDAEGDVIADIRRELGLPVRA